jgi:hypothetical protein
MPPFLTLMWVRNSPNTLRAISSSNFVVSLAQVLQLPFAITALPPTESGTMFEKGLFQAAVEEAEGALERSKAAKTLSEIQLQRAEELVAKSAGTVVARIRRSRAARRRLPAHDR